MTVPVHLTSQARIDHAPNRLVNGASVKIEGILQDFVLEVTELKIHGNDDPQPHGKIPEMVQSAIRLVRITPSRLPA